MKKLQRLLAQGTTHNTCVWNTTSLKVGRTTTIVIGNVSWVSSVLRGNGGIAPETRPPQLCSVALPIHYSADVLTLNGTDAFVKEMEARYEKLQSCLA
jgi:hypothetical protein